MQKKAVITIQDVTKPMNVQVFADLKVACSRMGWSYDFLKRKQIHLQPYLYKSCYYIQKKTIKYKQ